MTPFCRVKWTEPDLEKRAMAQQSLRDRVSADRRALHDLSEREMRRMIDSEPGIDAVIEHHGVLMSEAVYVSAHVTYDEIVGSLPSRRSRVVPAHWVCIVATEHGNVEMDPLRLTVTGVWIPGEPLGPE